MKYVALLRGINVGGNSIVAMSALKAAMEKAGFENVLTYINSGNVIFEAAETSSDKLETKIEQLLEKTFFAIKVVVVSQQELENVLAKVPAMWKKDDVRKYIAFIKKPAQPEELVKAASPKEGIDFIDKGPGVVYLSTKMEGLTKSSFPKLIQLPIYKNMTMRNMKTVEKLAKLMAKV